MLIPLVCFCLVSYDGISKGTNISKLKKASHPVISLDNFPLHPTFNIQSVITNSQICLTGAPGCVNDSLLTGLQFVEGFEAYFFVSRWTMHQLVISKFRVVGLVDDKWIFDFQDEDILKALKMDTNLSLSASLLFCLSD